MPVAKRKNRNLISGDDIEKLKALESEAFS